MLTSIPLRERKKAATKERIYQAAVHLFKQHGFTATTVDDILAAADISKGTFFNYFPTKEAVLHHFGEQQAFTAAQELAETLPDPRLNTREKLQALVRAVTRNVEADRELTRVVVFEILKSTLDLVREPSRALFRQTVMALMAEGRQRGEVRLDLDPEVGSLVITGVYFQQLFEWCVAEEPFSLSDRLDQLLAAVWEGLGR